MSITLSGVGPQHVGVKRRQCLSFNYEHGIGLPIPWCGPYHVGVGLSQWLSAIAWHWSPDCL